MKKATADVFYNFQTRRFGKFFMIKLPKSR